MYCPRCSQQQISEDVSFCTRCGFQLGPVKELLAGGGSVPQIIPPAGRWSQRRRVRLGAKLMFFSLVLLPIFFAISLAVDEAGPLVPPALIFLVGLAFVLYSWIFGEAPATPKTTATFPGVTSRGLQSPTSPSLSPAAFGELPVKRANTAEIIHPPSVTERTTSLLEKATD